ncbi:MAG TPA: DUF4333 domain-containing protein [Nocardioidaceae bacterium]|nr:DUF4333 domain-containing protein [Nocardioidaceae bacterium]
MSRSALAASVVLLGLLGCSEQFNDPPAETPELGGARPTTSSPEVTMDDLERQVSRRLGRQVAAHRLHLDALECPVWGGAVPTSLSCRGWFDSVPGTVRVKLRRDASGMVAFDASLTGGVVATAMLVDDLVGRGYEDVDCGTVPAYPTEVGSTITCAVTSDDVRSQVVVTITDAKGSVTISAF